MTAATRPDPDVGASAALTAVSENKQSCARKCRPPNVRLMRSAEVDPQQPFRILYTGRSQPLDVAARCLQFRSPGYSYCTPRGRQRFGGAKCQELRAALVALVAFITISKCDDRPRAVMGDKAEEVRADCRSLLGLRSAGNTDQRERG